MSENCPICQAENSIPLSPKQWLINGINYSLVICQKCGSARTTPLPTDAILEDLYHTSFDYRWYQDHYETKLRDCRIRIKEYRNLLGQRTLDFGGGLGYFSRAAIEAGLESVTFDPYTANANHPIKGNWDSVVALHVLEHANNLDRTVSLIKEFLAPGGRIILAVPNFAGEGYRKRGIRWVWAQPPLIHIFHFTATGISELLTRHGFTDIQQTYHERWDANLYCDVEHAEHFRTWDTAWSIRPLNALPLYRKLIARINSYRRFRGLEAFLRNYDSSSDIYSELQVTAILKKS